MTPGLADILAAAGLDPDHATPAEIIAAIRDEATCQSGYAMAAVKRDRSDLPVHFDEALATLSDPVTPGDPVRTARTLQPARSLP